MDASFDRAVADLQDIAGRLATAGPRVHTLASIATRKTAHDIEAYAKQDVPVDTGATRDSIGSDIEETNGDDYRIDVETGPQTWYAPLLEEGTERMPPRPFEGPAFDRAIPPWVAALESVADPLGST